jgi:Domain of unknown function (DUF1877)
MSVMGAVQLVNDVDVAWLRQHVRQWGDNLPEDPDDREVLGAADHLYCEIGKASQAVSFLLTGGTKTGPLSFLDNETLGEKTRHEFAYGPGRLFPTTFILELKAAMDAIPDDVVAQRLRDPAIQQLYPFNVGGRALDDGDREWLSHAFDGLSAFVWQAVERVRQGDKSWLLVAYF